eukprot:3188175-Pleurochrysis_carterae.AAC.1
MSVPCLPGSIVRVGVRRMRAARAESNLFFSRTKPPPSSREPLPAVPYEMKAYDRRTHHTSWQALCDA